MKINISPLWQNLGIEDKVSLIQQLYDAYWGEALPSGDIVHIKDSQAEEYIRKNPRACGFRNEETIKEITAHKAISPIDSNSSRFPYYDKTTGINIYKIIIDWDNVAKYAGFLQDHEADEQYGFAQQKQIIRDALQKLDKNSTEKDLIITEKIMGKYLDHVSLAQAVRGDDSPDRHIKFIDTLRGLEREGFLIIHKMEYKFDALPIPAEEETQRLEQGVFVDEDAYFYPAEHCKITVELTDSKSVEGLLLKEEAKHAIPVEAILSAIDDDENVREKEEFYKDEVQLVSKLLQICSPDFLDLEIVTPAESVKSDRFRAGFNLQKTIDALNRKKVFERFKELRSRDSSRKSYKATVNYQNLLKFTEELHDEVESLKGNVYDSDIQKKGLLKLLKEEFSESPQEKNFIVSEAILGSYQPENSTNRPAGISLTRPDKERPDIRYQFMRTLRALEKEKHFTINSVNFDFHATPIQTSESKKHAIWGSDEPFEYYPPQHCKVTLTVPATSSSKETLSSNGHAVVEELETIQPDNIYTCGSLVINISAATLKYKDNPAVDIQPKNREIKFLVMLAKNKNVVAYSEIATEIESTSFGEEVIARAVQYLKRDLKPILKKAGMTDEEIKKMIKPVKNTGYKIFFPQ